MRGFTLAQLQELDIFIRMRVTSHGYVQGWSDMGPPDDRRLTPQLLRFDATTMHHVVEWLIQPVTKTGDCCLAEFVSSEPQKPKWYISYFGGDLFRQFTACVEHHANMRGDSNEPFWACMFAHKQEEFSDLVRLPLEQAPFLAAMRLCVGLLVVVDGSSNYFSRTWCVFEMWGSVTHPNNLDNEHPTMLFDFVAADSKGSIQLITDGLLESEKLLGERDGAAQKRQRECDFPLDLVNQGLTLDFNDGQAVSSKDRKWLMNGALAYPWNSEAVVAKMESAVRKAAQAKVFKLINGTLRGMFAAATWREAVSSNSSSLSQGLLIAALLGDRSREHLRLDLSGIEGSHVNEHLYELAKSWPPRLLTIDLNCAGCAGLTHDDVALLSTALPSGLESLALNFNGCKAFADKGLKAMFTEFDKFERMSSLELNFGECPTVGNGTLRKLAAKMPQKLSYLKLTISGNKKLTNDGVETLVKSLPPGLSDVSLDFKQTGITKDSAKKCNSLESVLRWKEYLVERDTPIPEPVQASIDKMKALVPPKSSPFSGVNKMRGVVNSLMHIANTVPSCPTTGKSA